MKRNFKNSEATSSSIERDINAIFNGIEAGLREGLVAEKTRPSRGSVFCKGEIKIYRKEDLARMSNDNSFKALPLETYAFYSDTLRPSRIGSVAIYGENAFKRWMILNKRGFFFVRKIVSVNVEQGRRPFVDVRLTL